MSNVARMEIPNRMRSVNVRMSIDDMPIVATMDYLINDNGILPVAVWVKTKKSESTLDRELRSSGKAVSLLLQYGCSLKEISETFTRDSIIGSVVWYLFARGPLKTIPSTAHAPPQLHATDVKKSDIVS